MTTKDERVDNLKRAIRVGGGIVKFSRDMGVTHQAVNAWKKRGAVPFDRAAVIEMRYGVPRVSLIEPRLASAFLMTAEGSELL